MLKNNLSFKFSSADLLNFVTIFLKSCYNVRPQCAWYWALSEDVNCPLVARIMSRFRFREINSLLHVCGNNQLELNDK